MNMYLAHHLWEVTCCQAGHRSETVSPVCEGRVFTNLSLAIVRKLSSFFANLDQSQRQES